MDLARRFRGLPEDAPRLARAAPFNHTVGDSAQFTLVDLTVPQSFTVTATVRAITGHAYFFVEDGTSYSQSSLDQIASDFESAVYPRVTAVFGSEWSPGVDSDPRIAILHAGLRGAGGYVSGSDSFPAAVAPHSNEREMIYIDSRNLNAPGPAYNSLLAHELQHLIHAHADPNEESWVNEGLSQVSAEIFAGSGGSTQPFLDNPDTQLNFWPPLGDTAIHYAASELFLSYLLDHYGGRDQASRLLQRPEDGIEGVSAHLKRFNKTFEEVFADWVVANYLDDATGPYAHHTEP